MCRKTPELLFHLSFPSMATVIPNNSYMKTVSQFKKTIIKILLLFVKKEVRVLIYISLGCLYTPHTEWGIT